MRVSTPPLSGSPLAVAAALAALLAFGCAAEPRRSVGPEGTSVSSRLEGGARTAPEASSEALVDPGAVSSVGLADLLAYADVHAPLLIVARSRRALGDAALAEAAPLLFANPQLQAQAGPRIGLGSVALDFQISLVQQVSVSGERGARVTAAERFRELTEAEIAEVRWLVRCDVHAGFRAALVARERAKLVAQILSFQEGVAAVVKRQIVAGDTPALNARLVEAEVAQALQQKVAAEQAYLAARISLAELSGWPVSRSPVPAGDLEAPREVPAADALFATARERLPAFRVYEAAVREAEARAEAEHRASFPQPSIGAQVSREGSVSAEPASIIVQGIVSVPLPIWQRNQGPLARARADVDVAGARRSAAETVLRAQVAKNRSEVAAAAERVRSYRADVLPRFDENLKLVRRAFELGEVDLLQVSVARDRFFRIQLDALGAHLDYFAALVALERTVGVDLWAGGMR